VISPHLRARVAGLVLAELRRRIAYFERVCRPDHAVGGIQGQPIVPFL